MNINHPHGYILRGQKKNRIVNLILTIITLIGLVFFLPDRQVRAASLLNTNFDSDSGGFTYTDDTFGTSQPTYASGSRLNGSNCYAGSGGCLNVRLGGVNSNTITNMSGGWVYTLSLASDQTGVSLSLRYRLVMPAAYIYDEYSHVLVSLDGTLFGRGSKSYIDHTGGDGNFAHDSGWLQVSVYLGTLSAGNHTLILGGLNNKKTSSSKITDIYLDDVAVTGGNPTPVPSDAQILVSRIDYDQFKTDIQTLSNFGDRCRTVSPCTPGDTFTPAQDWVIQQLTNMGYTPVKWGFTYSGFTGSDVWATKTGTVTPTQMYMLGGHLDGRGGGGAADDDGSADALMLEVARALNTSGVSVDKSIRVIFWDNEEAGLYGSHAYDSDRKSLQGTTDEPTWLGLIQNDMILYDHGVGTNSANQSPYADLDVEWKAGTTYATQSQTLAQSWRFLSGTYSALYPSNSADNSNNTDDTSFQNDVASISVRENRRGLSGEWISPYNHSTGDIYANYSEDDFKLGLNAIQTTLGTVAELAGIHLTGANHPPVGDPQSLVTPKNNVLAITLTAADADSNTLTYSLVTNPSHGTLTGTAPNLTYTPASNYTGYDSFTFKANDGTVDSQAAPVTINVTATVNNPPVANPQSVSTNEDTAVGIALTGSDPDGDTLTYSVVTNPSHGALSGTAPALTYTPSANYNGSDSFTFKVNDGKVDSSPATVSITVNPINHPPVANSQSLSTGCNTSVGIAFSGSDVDGDTLSFTVASNPSHGGLSGTSPNLTYTPTGGFSGSDSFTYTAYDGTVTSPPATVSIAVGSCLPALPLPFVDDFETDQGWTVNPSASDTAMSGRWERAIPQPTSDGSPKQIVAYSEYYDLVTGALAGSGPGDNDVSGGVTSIRSPLVQLPSGQDITLAFQYYFAHACNSSPDDYLRVQVIGSSTVTVLEVHGNYTDVDASWASFSANLNIFAGQAVYLLVQAADNYTDSLVEAGLDNLSITASASSSPLLSATFDSSAQGFTFAEDAFRSTSQPDYENGVYQSSGGIRDGGLEVDLGGVDSEIVTDMSGGWSSSFDLSSAGTVEVQFWYNLSQSPDYDAGECSQALVSLDGSLYGTTSDGYIAQICGNGNGGSTESTGWQVYSFSTSLVGGSHTLRIGGYNNRKAWDDESTQILIDEVQVFTQ